MIWVIGDIQGCYQSLEKLLKKINFNPKYDKLWIAGDLVNRGDESLQTLEYLHSIKDSLEIVLGNHDMALIAAYYGIKKSNSTIDPILNSPRAKELIEWLCGQQFLHVDANLGYCMSHAGISPSFDLDMALAESCSLENSLQGKNIREWLVEIFAKDVVKYDSSANKIDAQRYAMASFTRMRFCNNNAKFDFKQKGSPDFLPLEKQHLKPWFEIDIRKKIDLKILFGHWSTLGLYSNSDVYSLDTGCVWDNRLTAIRIDNRSEEIVQVNCMQS